MTRAAEVRDALVVATAEYSDPKLQRLRAPAADAERLAAALGSPAIGGFNVEVALNAEERDLRRRLARFFGNRRPNDLLFLHLSCHGVKDARGELFLAAADTELELLSATAVSAAWLNEQLSATRSRRTVVLLDCCFSGSFPFGVRARAGGDISVPDQFQGDGRGLAVITASSAMEYAYEGDHLSGEGQPSFFTEAVVEALETGKADRDQDHRISVQELYDYVYDCVTERSPAQTPHMKSELQGPLYVARSMYTAPARLHDDLVALVEHPIAGARLGAVQELAALLGSSDPATALAARQTLQRLVDDDSGKVSRAASAALADGGKPAAAAPGEVTTGSEHEAPSSRRAAAPTKRDTARSEPAPESQPPISMQAGKGAAPPAEPALTERAPRLQVPPRRSRGRFGALLASGLAVAALAAGGVVLATSGDNPGPDPPVGGDGSARGPTGSGKGSGTGSGSSATSEGLSTWPASLSAYTVVLASATNRADAEAVAERAPARSPSGVLRSDNYASLRPGYWVAFSGQYTTADEAERAADRLRGQGFAGAYARHVSDEEP